MTKPDISLEKVSYCRNCNSPNISNYCSNCGQPIYTKRFTLKSYLITIFNTFSLEKGFFYTLIMLFIKPGILINDYLKGKTRIYINPLKYLLIIGSVFAFIMLKTTIIDTSYQKGNDLIYGSTKNINQEYAELQKDESATKMQQKMLSFVKKYIHIVPLFILPFYSLIGLWFYRSKKLFYGEFLIITSFVIAQNFLITILILLPLIFLIPILANYFPIISAAASFLFFSYVLNKTFKESPFISLIKGTFIYVIGTLLFWIFLAIFFLLLGIILKMIGISLLDIIS